MRRVRIVCLVFWMACACFEQVLAQAITSEWLERDAVDMTDRKRANDTLYNTLKDYKAIMVGGVLGTKEPTEFFIGLVKSFIKNGKKVIAAVELPTDGVNLKETLTLEKLKKSPAFTTHTRDGRQSIAWAEMLVELQQTGAQILLFDLSMEHKRALKAHRDSLLYGFLNDTLKKEDTNKVFISISANVVSRTLPFNKLKSLGYYLKKDENSFFKGKNMLSLNFLYNDGTTWYWLSDGYKKRNIEGNAGVFAYAAPYESYLFVYPNLDGYNGIIFSSTITASGPLVEEK